MKPQRPTNNIVIIEKQQVTDNDSVLEEYLHDDYYYNVYYEAVYNDKFDPEEDGPVEDIIIKKVERSHIKFDADYKNCEILSKYIYERLKRRCEEEAEQEYFNSPNDNYSEIEI